MKCNCGLSGNMRAKKIVLNMGESIVHADSNDPGKRETLGVGHETQCT